MDFVAQIDSLPGLIENWRLTRRLLRKGDKEVAETVHELATAIISVLEYSLMDVVESGEFVIRKVPKESSTGLTKYFSFRLSEFLITLRVSDTLSMDDNDDDDDEEDGESFKTDIGNVDLFDCEEAIMWLERRIRLHVGHPHRVFFMARVDYEANDEKPDQPLISEMDNGDSASLGLIRLCEIIERKT